MRAWPFTEVMLGLIQPNDESTGLSRGPFLDCGVRFMRQASKEKLLIVGDFPPGTCV